MIRSVAWVGAMAALAALVGCSAVKVQPHTQLPPPLIEKLPVTVAVYFPAEFREYSYKERRNQVDYEFELGAAHVAKLSRLLQAMFTRVVEIDDPTQALSAAPDVKLVLEPRFEAYAFLTPRDMAGDFYTVTIRYRLDLYNPRGERVDGYVFTGYGRQKSSAMSGTEPLVRATERAMRDAGAKLAVEFPEQESVRRLLAGDELAAQPDREQDVRQALGSFGAGPEAATSGPTAGQEKPDDSAAPEAGPGTPGIRIEGEGSTGPAGAGPPPAPDGRP